MASNPKHPGGRPSKYSKEIADLICQRLIRGEPLARICDDEGMPHYTTIRRWEDENPEFRSLSSRAKQDGTHWLADDCLRIADDPSLDPADKRVRIDTRLRLIGKWHAKAYGEKIDITQTATVTHVHKLDEEALADMDTEDLAAMSDMLARLVSKGEKPKSVN